METQNNNGTGNAFQGRIRIGLILAGIATALLCSLVLGKDDTSTNSVAADLQLLETSGIIENPVWKKVTNPLTVAAIWPVK